MKKVFILTNGNGKIEDVIIGDDSSRSMVERTLDVINESLNNDYIKAQVYEFDTEDEIKEFNVVAIQMLNGVPKKIAINSPEKQHELILEAERNEDDYKYIEVKIETVRYEI